MLSLLLLLLLLFFFFFHRKSEKRAFVFKNGLALVTGHYLSPVGGWRFFVATQ